MLTADTITDEQIRELRRTSDSHGPDCRKWQELIGSALQGNRDARREVAEVLNARNAVARTAITAETITGEQIRDLRREAHRLVADTYDAERNPDAYDDIGMRADVARTRHEARARCADILSARMKEGR